MSKSTRIFLSISLALLISDILFVAINYQADRETLQQSLDERGSRYRDSYYLTLHATLTSMLQMATFISHDVRIQQLFLVGKKAVEAEGGGAGGVRSAAARKALFDAMAPSWRQMADEFDVRQLQFHLGPGSLSFLRVHQPEKYGDRMDDVRHMIVDSFANQEALIGFETGRVYSGLRGAVPVYADDPETGEKVHVGTLEVGTAYMEMLALIDRELDVGVAALLKRKHVESAMWEQFVREGLSFESKRCSCKLEAATRVSEVGQVLDEILDTGIQMDHFGTEIIPVDGENMAVTHFALFDYRSNKEGLEVPVGALVLWSNADEEMLAYQRSLRQNLLFAAAGFVLIEVLLWYGIQLVTRRLEREIGHRTEQVRTLNARLRHQATTDALTGLPNRRRLMTDLEGEVRRAQRYGMPMTLLMFDLDHFKQINDRHGHQLGDQVLRYVGEVMSSIKRSTDVVGRYGGEEFCVALPHSELEAGVTIGERLREQVNIHAFEGRDGEAVHATISVGVATLVPGMTLEALIGAADEALYFAKATGRNRVEAYRASFSQGDGEDISPGTDLEHG